MSGAEHSLTNQAELLVSVQTGLKEACATPLKIVLAIACQCYSSNHRVRFQLKEIG
jgi:hypothetical protein